MSVIGSREAMPLPCQGHCPKRECSWHSGPAKALGRPLEGVWSPVEAVASGRAKGSSLDYLEKVPWGGPVTSSAFSLPQGATSLALRETLHGVRKREFLDFLGVVSTPAPTPAPQVVA